MSSPASTPCSGALCARRAQRPVTGHRDGVTLGLAMGNAAPATKTVAQVVLLDGTFSNMPRILAEGSSRHRQRRARRHPLCHQERHEPGHRPRDGARRSGLPVPAAPDDAVVDLRHRHPMGIAAAILALAPNNQRYTPGFLKRVLALAIPSGIAAGAVSFIAHDTSVSFGDMPPQEKSVSVGLGPGRAAPHLLLAALRARPAVCRVEGCVDRRHGVAGVPRVPHRHREPLVPDLGHEGIPARRSGLRSVRSHRRRGRLSTVPPLRSRSGLRRARQDVSGEP